MSDTKYNTLQTPIDSLLNFPKFAQNIYQCLYPSEPAITPDDIKPISLAGVYNEDPHNDFGFFVRDKRIMLFVETQHEPPQNALLRSMLYLAAAYSNFCIENHLPVYKEAPVSLPRPEVFLICTENNSEMPDTLQLFDSKDNSKPVSIKAKVLKHTGLAMWLISISLFARFAISKKPPAARSRKHGAIQFKFAAKKIF